MQLLSFVFAATAAFAVSHTKNNAVGLTAFIWYQTKSNVSTFFKGFFDKIKINFYIFWGGSAYTIYSMCAREKIVFFGFYLLFLAERAPATRRYALNRQAPRADFVPPAGLFL